MGRNNEKGFILFSVILILAVIGSIAIVLNQEGIQGVKEVATLTEIEQAKYSAEAGLVFAKKELLLDTDCTGYNDNVTNSGTFNGNDYNVSVTPDNGSPVTIKVEVDHGLGVTKEFSRQVTMNDAGAAAQVNLNPTQGAHIRSTDISSNFSGEDTLHVKYREIAFGTFTFPTVDRVSILQFDLSSVTTDVSNIISASLELHLSGSADSSNTVETQIRRLNVDWLEDEATFSERLSGVSWTGSDIESGNSATTTVDEGVIGWVNWDVTDLVISWLDGTYTNYGLEIWGESGNVNNLEFISHTNSDTSKHPVLKIAVKCECGRVCS